MKNLFRRFLEFINRKNLVGEICRFIIVGGLATVVDFFAMGVTKYICQPEIYPSFISVFLTFMNGIKSSTAADMAGTGVGFIFGLIANYLLSVVFVFNEEGNSKTAQGIIKFVVFSLIGFGMHELGMFLFSRFTPVNEWITKVLMTCIVLVYNYVTRKLFIFNRKGEKQEEFSGEEQNECTTDLNNGQNISDNGEAQ
ncbi:MAG: GtrA family protein [Christensenellaceae bacterium]